jgi:hypothetical protein
MVYVFIHHGRIKRHITLSTASLSVLLPSKNYVSPPLTRAEKCGLKIQILMNSERR